MRYEDARPKIRSGDLLSFSHGGWDSVSSIKVNIVRMATRSRWSHVALAWVVGGRVFALEAVKPKVRIYPLSLLGDFDWIPLQAPWHPQTEQFAMDRIGVDYSELTAIRAFYEPLADGDVRECAAYVREVMKRDGIDLGPMSRPDALVQRALEHGSSITFIQQKQEETRGA